MIFRPTKPLRIRSTKHKLFASASPEYQTITMKKTKKPAPLELVKEDIRALNACMTDDAVRELQAIESLRSHYKSLDERVTALQDSAGPTWKTAAGYVLRMRDMSDSHLSNALLYLQDVKAGRKQFAKKFGNVDVKLQELCDEQARRAEDRRQSGWGNPDSNPMRDVLQNEKTLKDCKLRFEDVVEAKTDLLDPRPGETVKQLQIENGKHTAKMADIRADVQLVYDLFDRVSEWWPTARASVAGDALHTAILKLRATAKS